MNIHSSWQFVKLVYNYQLYLQQSSFMSMIMFSEKLSKRFPLSLCVPNEACWGGEVLSRLMFADCVEIAREWGSLIQLYTSHQSGFHFYLNCCFRAEIFWQGYNVFLQRRNKETWDYDPPGIYVCITAVRCSKGGRVEDVFLQNYSQWSSTLSRSL